MNQANHKQQSTTPDLAIVHGIREALREFPFPRVVILFGSAAGNRLTPSSDLDLAISAGKPLSLDQRIAVITRLSECLHREIDLIDLEAVSGFILASALCKGYVIRKDREIYTVLLKKMWYNQADMLPHTRRILRERYEKFIAPH